MRNSDRRVPGTILAALLACAACTDEEPAGATAPHDGPLSLGGGQGTLCLPAGTTRDYTLGGDGVRNTTSADIQVTKITLIDATNATMIGGYLAPIRNNTLVGTFPGWPPIDTDTTAFDAKQSIPTVVPSRDTMNLLVHIQATAPAKVGAVEVTYVSDGKRWRVRNTTALEIEKACT